MFIPQNMVIILCMEEILHQLLDGLSIVYAITSYYLQCFIVTNSY